VEFPLQIATSLSVTGPNGSYIRIDASDGSPLIKFQDELGIIWRLDAFNFAGIGWFSIGGQVSTQPEILFITGDGIFFSPDETPNGVMIEPVTGVLKYTTGLVAGKQTWLNATLQNGWTNFGGGYAPASYLLMPDGMVQLRGTITGGTKVDGTTLFTIPFTDMRPSFTKQLLIRTEASGSQSYVEILTDGRVQIHVYPAGNALTLDSVSFPGSLID
jgi:hypothetical protein